MTNNSKSFQVQVMGEDVQSLASVDAVAGLFDRLGYDTSKRAALPAQAIGLGDKDGDIEQLEVLSEDAEGLLRVILAKVRSITAKVRSRLVSKLGQRSEDHLIVLVSDFEVLEFVLIEKVQRHRTGPGGMQAYRPEAKTISVSRRSPEPLCLRQLTGLAYTGQDGLDQFEKLKGVFAAAEYTNANYQNRALFADYYLDTRLREGPAWGEAPNETFAAIKAIVSEARPKLVDVDEAAARAALYEPLFKALGFEVAPAKEADDDAPKADYELHDADGNTLTVALVYEWERLLDAADPKDAHTPKENPGAAVVSILERGDADWVIVTNGRQWRLYSRRAPSRSTNFYEVDLPHALSEAADTDPNTAFRYWWLFFRPEAFQTLEANGEGCWLDQIAQGSQEYARQVEKSLRERVYQEIVPIMAQGFLADRRQRLGIKTAPAENELEDIRHGTLYLLYRLLFLLYAECRDLLPVRESNYQGVSLKAIKEEIAKAAGIAAGKDNTTSDGHLGKAYDRKSTDLYDRLLHLFDIIADGDPGVNVPRYNGGLFDSANEESKSEIVEEAPIGRFLIDHKIPDIDLAKALDRLAREPDEKKGFELVFIDYKSLGVQQLGSIYEGLLEYRLRIAEEDLTAEKQKGGEKFISLAKSKKKRPRLIVPKGQPYLTTDKSERKATGSYYTPAHIVDYIVENAVGPVLDEKLIALRPVMREAQKTYQRHKANWDANPAIRPDRTDQDAFLAAKTLADHGELVEMVFDCKVLDPAMGSGHFLVKAVDFISDRLLDFLNRFPNSPVWTALEQTRRSILASLDEFGVSVDERKLTDVHLLKRHVLKRCIYGVDLNPMAVELAKVSLWLDAFTLGAPLSFLDHHIRCGNSLIGEMSVSDHILPGSEQEGKFLQAINNMVLIARSADATAEDVETSKKLFEEIESLESPFRRRLNVATASHFINVGNIDRAQGYAQRGDSPHDVTPEARKSAEGALAAQEIAEVRRFFHWPLAFPEVFFGIREGTERHIEERPADSCGFDAVIGNPPYGAATSKEVEHYLEKTYGISTGKVETYVYFLLLAERGTHRSGIFSLITPNAWLSLRSLASLRRLLLNENTLRSILDCPGMFDEWVNTAATVMEKGTGPQSSPVAVWMRKISIDGSPVEGKELWPIRHTLAPDDWKNDLCQVRYSIDPVSREVMQQLEGLPIKVEQLLEGTTGFQVYHNTLHTSKQISERFLHSTRKQGPDYTTFVRGSSVDRYSWSVAENEYLRLVPELVYRMPEPRFFESPKIMIQEIASRRWRKVNAAVALGRTCCDNTVLILAPLAGVDPAALWPMCAFFNSRLFTWFLLKSSDKAYATGDFSRLNVHDFLNAGIPAKLTVDEELSVLAAEMAELKADLHGLVSRHMSDLLAATGLTSRRKELVGLTTLADSLGDPERYRPPSPVSAIRKFLVENKKILSDDCSLEALLSRASVAHADASKQANGLIQRITSLDDRIDSVVVTLAGLTTAQIDTINEGLAEYKSKAVEQAE